MNSYRLLPPGVTVIVSLLLGAGCLDVHAWQSDNGDGTFTNPPLYADYPDPDIIRVGEDFYFATTTFVNSPGLTILHSQDLVNWEIVSHVIPRLTGSQQYDMINGVAYRNGVFAPSLRCYDGTFYVVVTPNGMNTRVYYANSAAGPWQYHQLSVSAFDPGLYIETNGVGYVFTSGGGDGHVTVHTLNANFSQIVATSNNVFYYQGIEGSKVVKRGNYYYCFNAHPGDLSLKISRATNIFGMWETIPSISDGTGGHQGAIVDLPDGRDFGFVMKDSGAIGRMTSISPIVWSNNWPYWGTSNALNQVPRTASKPIQGRPILQPETSDDFSASTLGLQWQWNHNPDTNRFSLTERPGFLRLKPTPATNFWYARNTLTQKGQGLWSRGEVKLDLSHGQAGDVFGFGTLGKTNGQIAVTVDASGNKTLNMRIIVDLNGSGSLSQTTVAAAPFTGTNLYLRTEMNFQTGMGHCSYSADGINWTTLGGQFNLAFDWQSGTFQGEQFAIFCYNSSPGTGCVDVDYFSFADTTESRPSAPTGLSATAASSFQINLAWNASTNATSYNIKRSTTSGGPYTVIATGVTATNYIDNSPAAGTTYYCVVSALNAGGETTNSAPASVTTPPSNFGALFHRYSFSETGGTTVADSVGGSVWNGTLSDGGTFSSGQLTLASASQQHVLLPAGIVSALNDFTIETWVRLNSTDNWTRIFDFGNSTTVNMFLTPRNGSNGRVRYAITTSGAGGEQQITGASGLITGAWYWVAVTLNGSTGLLYLNGVPLGTNSAMTLKPSSLGSTANNYLGRSQYADPYLNGAIDEFRIYSVALSSAEIAAAYHLGPNQLLSTDGPPISVSATPTDLTLVWPLAFAGFTRQSRTNLALGNWVNVTSPDPQIVGTQWQVTLPQPSNTGSMFYRLVK